MTREALHILGLVAVGAVVLVSIGQAAARGGIPGALGVAVIGALLWALIYSAPPE